MQFFTRTASRRPSTPPPDNSISSPTSAPSQPPPTSGIHDPESWDLLTPPDSGHTTPANPVSLSESSSFDTETFPAESYLYPTDRNGTQTSLHRQARDLNWPTCQNKLQGVSDSALESLNARVNQAFEGHDVVELGNRVAELIPSVSMPGMRQLSQAIDSVTDVALSVAARRRLPTGFVEQELQGDQWAFARVMGAKARQALVEQKICKEWQVVPNQITSGWLDRLNVALAAMFMREKTSYDVGSLFSMVTVWLADGDRKTWRLELDTGLTDIEVDPETDEHSERAICLAVGFELPESCGALSLANVNRGAVDGEGEWMMVVD